MKCNPEVWWVWTKDKIRLQGMHYFPLQKDTCVLFIHGQSGNYIDSVYAEVLGKLCVDAELGFVFAHNRGWGIMNDLTIQQHNKGRIKNDWQRGGAVYERFIDSLKDIEVFIHKTLSVGYKKIVLVGHSYAGPKTIYYLSQKSPPEVTGLVLASAADMVGLTKKDEGTQYQSRVNEAKKLIENGKGEELMQHPVGDWVRLSARTFLDQAVDYGKADVLPIFRNPNVFPELSKINIPILAIYGDKDSVTIRSTQEDLKLIQKKAVNSPRVETHIISHCDHVYTDCEEEFASDIVQFTASLS